MPSWCGSSASRPTPSAWRARSRSARAADESMLAEVTGLERDALQNALRESVSEQVLVAGADGRFGFRHALLREALYDDLLPGERGELHIALARELEQRCGADDDRELERASSIAGHYGAAGDQPNALRSTIAAARAAHKVYAYGEALDLTERALELWPRVDDPEQVAGLDHVSLLTMAAQAHQIQDERARSVVLINEALRELDPDADPARYAGLLALQARITASLNRGEEAVEIAERALAMLPEDDPGGSGRCCWPGWRARGSCAGASATPPTEGEAALEVAIAAGDRLPPRPRCSTPWAWRTCRWARSRRGSGRWSARSRSPARTRRLRQPGHGVQQPRRHVRPRRSNATRRWRPAKEGLAATPAPPRAQPCLDEADARRRWRSRRASGRRAQESLSPAADPALVGLLLHLPPAASERELALGVGDEEVAERVPGRRRGPGGGDRPSPSGSACYGALRAELRGAPARPGRARRPRSQEALDRLEVCTDDVMGIARISCRRRCGSRPTGPQRARDLREPAERRDALARARMHVERLAAAAQDGGPVERARLAQGKAELARARGRGAAREWARAAAAWEEIERPYPVAIARWREAEALVAADDRAGASEPAAAGAGGGRGAGRRSGWPREVRTLAERARLDVASAPPTERRSRRQRRRRGRGCRGPLRPDPARAPGAGPAGRGGDQPADRRGARTWPRRPRACTCRGSWPSSGSRVGPRRLRWCTGCTWRSSCPRTRPDQQVSACARACAGACAGERSAGTAQLLARIR